MSDPLRWHVGLVGYGEVGRILAEDLRARGVAVSAHDLKFATDAAPALQSHAAAHGVTLAASHAALAARLDIRLPPVARWFVYLPLEHSEQLADQDEAVRRFESLPHGSPGRDNVIDFARRHREIVARFGRFPHRNAALGRTDTPDERAWLAAGGGF